jgi:hypothetical protein
MLSGAVATCACRPAVGTTPDRVTADDFRFDATVADVASNGDCRSVADLDGGGTMDVALSSSKGTKDLRWWCRPESAGDAWQAQTILPDIERAHMLQAGDMDNDGDLDLVVAQMHTSEDWKALVLENFGGATSWREHLIDTTGLHNGMVVDIGNDGDLDSFGANWVGNPPVRLWISRLDPDEAAPRLDRLTLIERAGRNERTFGLGLANIDGDGHLDLAATTGERKTVELHRNPGNHNAAWTAFELADLTGDARRPKRRS